LTSLLHLAYLFIHKEEHTTYDSLIEINTVVCRDLVMPGATAWLHATKF